MKIVMTRKLLQGDQDYIAAGLRKNGVTDFALVEPETFDEAGILNICGDADVLLGPFVTRSILAHAPKLRLVQVPWTGMDTFAFSEMEGSSVPVCNSHSNAQAVAEIGFALAADLMKKLSYHDRKMRAGNWNRDQKPLDLKSKMIADQTVCIIGYGNIGSRLGNMFLAFGAKVLAVNFVEIPVPEQVTLYLSDRTAEAVAAADLVILTVPLTEKTRNMVDAEFLAGMKPGSSLVLLSRAGIVDEAALYEALTAGTLAGYASDVWWRAPKRGESEAHVSDRFRFEDLDQVVLSPHRAGFSEGTLPHLDDAIVNLTNLATGKPLINIVNIKEEY